MNLKKYELVHRGIKLKNLFSNKIIDLQSTTRVIKQNSKEDFLTETPELGKC